MSVEEIQDKNGNDITEGDFVYTKYRGGSHEGKVGFHNESFVCANVLRHKLTRKQVEMIVKDQATAQHEGVASYPKASPISETRLPTSLLICEHCRSSTPINMVIESLTIRVL